MLLAIVMKLTSDSNKRAKARSGFAFLEWVNITNRTSKLLSSLSFVSDSILPPSAARYCSASCIHAFASVAALLLLPPARNDKKFVSWKIVD